MFAVIDWSDGSIVDLFKTAARAEAVAHYFNGLNAGTHPLSVVTTEVSA